MPSHQAVMGTIVTIDVVDHDGDPACAAAVDRAFGWFRHVEACCSRFDAGSELRKACARVGEAVPVGDTLFEAARFALAVAEASGGAFDPTVGAAMTRAGFNRHYHTGELVPVGPAQAPVSYHDVQLDEARRTITLRTPLVLDLGAVAKGLAVDMAARELAPFEHFAIDAGGDLYLAGHNRDGEPWSVGIRHPRIDGMVLERVRVSDMAVCTSGDYARRSGSGDAGAPAHHLLDPRTGTAASALASVTVLAPTALVADALATAAFVLGPEPALRFLERHGVAGLLVTPNLERYATDDFP